MVQFLPQPVQDDIYNDVNGLLYQQLITAAKAQTGSRLNMVTDVAGLLSGREDYQLIWLNQNQRITSITHYSGTTAAITPTHALFSLRSLTKGLLAVTADGLTAAWAANTAYTGTLVTPYVVPVSGYYYIGRMVTAATVPTLRGFTGDATLNTIPPVTSATSADTGLTTVLPATGGVLTPVALQVFATVN